MGIASRGAEGEDLRTIAKGLNAMKIAAVIIHSNTPVIRIQSLWGRKDVAYGTNHHPNFRYRNIAQSNAPKRDLKTQVMTVEWLFAAVLLLRSPLFPSITASCISRRPLFISIEIWFLRHSIDSSYFSIVNSLVRIVIYQESRQNNIRIKSRPRRDRLFSPIDVICSKARRE